MENDKPSLRRQVADDFLAAMNTATSPLFFPRPAGATRSPVNPASGKSFSGLNRLLLSLADEGADPRWLTKNQAEGLGYSPREEAMPKKLVLWQHERMEDVLDQDGQPKLDGEGRPMKQTVRLERPFLSHYQVYQARDLQNAEGQAFPAYVPLPPEKEPSDRATDILANSGVVIKASSPGTASYEPRDDSLRLPPRELTPDQDYLTLAVRSLVEREVHRLSKSKDQEAQRNGGRPDDSEKQVLKSLTTAIAALMVAQDLGLRSRPPAEAYTVFTWRRQVENNPDLLFQAAAQAEKVRARVTALEQGPEQARASAPKAAEKDGNEPPELCGEKVYLDVSWEEKDKAKALGATWDKQAQAWCARPGTDLKPLREWIPDFERERVRERMVRLEGERVALNVPYQDRQKAKEMGAFWDDQEKSWMVSLKHKQLTELTQRWMPSQAQTVTKEQEVKAAATMPEFASETVILEVPFAEKDQAKAAGARFDPEQKLWLAPVGTDLTPLASWLPAREPKPEQALAAKEEFAQLLKERGFILDGPPLMDGRIHRVPVQDSRPQAKGQESKAQEGAYYATMQGVRPNGWLKNHRSGEYRSWLYTAQVMSPEQKAGLQKEAEARKRSRPPKARPKRPEQVRAEQPRQTVGMGR
jgi:antirestriction protein ArdC